MKYPIALLVVASVTLLLGVGIRMHADWRLSNKLYYHTADSEVYEFEDVFVERKIGDGVQLWSVVAVAAGGFWFVIVKIRSDRKRL
ncbi:MAG TPA: hypothetical protein VGG02_11010 [Chthoniobacterales bacterium]|jgi:hypothetical protein